MLSLFFVPSILLISKPKVIAIIAWATKVLLQLIIVIQTEEGVKDMAGQCVCVSVC